MKHILYGLCLAVLMMVLAQPQASAAAEYSATTRDQSPQQGERTGRIFVGANGMRTEYDADGETMVQIINYRSKEVLLLNTARKSYMRHSIAQAGAMAGGQQSMPANPCEGQQGVACKSAGVEEVNGRKAVKWIMTPQQGKAGGGTMTVWLDSQRHVPLRQIMPNGATMERRLLGKETVNQRQAEKWEMVMKGPDGSQNISYFWYDAALGTNVREEQPGIYVRDLFDIRVGPQPASLFTVPGGYSEIKSVQGMPQ